MRVITACLIEKGSSKRAWDVREILVCAASVGWPNTNGRYQNLPHHRDIAQAFKEAQADLRSAKLLLAGKEYSQTIVHCQHAAEKTLKAALALRNIIITRDSIRYRRTLRQPSLILERPIKLLLRRPRWRKREREQSIPSSGAQICRSGFRPNNIRSRRQ